MQALLAVVNKVAYSSHTIKGPTAANPELTGKLFECLSHMLRYVANNPPLFSGPLYLLTYSVSKLSITTERSGTC